MLSQLQQDTITPFIVLCRIEMRFRKLILFFTGNSPIHRNPQRVVRGRKGGEGEMENGKESIAVFHRKPHPHPQQQQQQQQEQRQRQQRQHQQQQPASAYLVDER